MTKPQKRYLKEVAAAATCSRKQKKSFIKEIKLNMKSFLQDYPQATEEQLRMQFGTPQEIAAGFIANNPDRVIKKLQIHKVVLIVVLLALVLYLAFLVASFLDVHEEAHGFFEEGILLLQFKISEVFLG